MKITLEEAIGILDLLGCGSDPVYRKGIQTSVNELQYHEDYLRHASPKDRKLKFHKTGSGKIVDGTLADLLMDRMGIKK